MGCGSVPSPADSSPDRAVPFFHLHDLKWLLQGIKKAQVFSLDSPVFLCACVWPKFCALRVLRIARREVLFQSKNPAAKSELSACRSVLGTVREAARQRCTFTFDATQYYSNTRSPGRFLQLHPGSVPLENRQRDFTICDVLHCRSSKSWNTVHRSLRACFSSAIQTFLFLSFFSQSPNAPRLVYHSLHQAGHSSQKTHAPTMSRKKGDVVQLAVISLAHESTIHRKGHANFPSLAVQIIHVWTGIYYSLYIMFLLYRATCPSIFSHYWRKSAWVAWLNPVCSLSQCQTGFICSV